MTEKKKYDTTIARIAGNLLSGYDRAINDSMREAMARDAVALARAIVAEVQRTEPLPEGIPHP
jgi:hypothetical protein